MSTPSFTTIVASNGAPTNPVVTTAPSTRSILGIHAAGLPTVELPRKDRPISDFAHDVGSQLSGADIFQRSGIPFILNEGKTALKEIKHRTFRTWVEDHFLCCRYVYVTPFLPPRQEIETMGVELANTVLNSPQFIQYLPVVDVVNSVSLPVMRKSNLIELLPKGYDPEAQVFTVYSVDYDKNMSLDEAVEFFDDLLAEFPFADPGRSKAVLMSCMLTLFAAGLLPDKTMRPAFIFAANAEGAGKTFLALIAVIAVTGRDTVQPLSSDEEEIRKRLLATLKSGAPVVVLDNLKGYLSSSALEGWLTAHSYEDRILGTSDNLSGEKKSTTIITGNGLTVSPDMRRRTLWIELFLEDLKAENRSIKAPLEVGDLHRLRPQVLSALWAMVREWDKAGRPEAAKTHASFIQWSKIIGGILEHAGYESPTLPPDLRHGGDTITEDFTELANHMGSPGVGSFDFMAVVRVCVYKGLFEFMLADVKDPKTSGCIDVEVPPKTKSMFGKFLSKWHGRMVGPGRFVVEGKGHSRVFRVERIAPAAAPASPSPAADTASNPF
jgi:hypothetical protein